MHKTTLPAMAALMATVCAPLVGADVTVGADRVVGEEERGEGVF